MGEQSIFKGDNINCLLRNDKIAELWLDHGSASVNKFDKKTLEDLGKAVGCIKKQEKTIRGLLIGSKKDVFVVGADVTEFKGYFAAGRETLKTWLDATHKLFAEIEDFSFPTVTAINGVCLGGGMELALTTSFRVASESASVGLPETKLGIYPGWGGTVRLPRLIGSDNAIEWIAGAGTYKPAEALQKGAVDAIVAPDKLHDSCLQMLHDAADKKLDWEQRRKEKISPLKIITPVEAAMVFEGAKGFVAAKAGKNYPAPIEAINRMQKAAGMGREEACAVEIEGFIDLAMSPVADNLITIFLSDQFNKKTTKKLASQGEKTPRVGVLGAGIMGGGIAYQSSSKKVPALMKDIATPALDLGMNEASKLLTKQLERKKITPDKMAKILSQITPTLNYGDFGEVPLVIEAVIENEKIKKSVYNELETVLPEQAVIATNTSTISITKLAEGLKDPGKFCGLHFFNPVHRMPLVEVIRGEKTSQETINTVVAYAMQIGKTPIVVNDCAGFLVNRVLFPYFYGFQSLLEDGADIRKIDKVMEKFGWPMGPAYLLDVIGLDTCHHGGDVMAKAFPDRMTYKNKTAINILNENNRLGQKNGKGFFSYHPDKKGKPKKQWDSDIENILKPVVRNKKELSDQDIIDRMMIPMINESARCLEEQIVRTAMEVDLGVLYGIGFPPFRAGVLKYADDSGLEHLVNTSESLMSRGEAFAPAPLLRKLASEGKKFYEWSH